MPEFELIDDKVEEQETIVGKEPAAPHSANVSPADVMGPVMAAAAAEAEPQKAPEPEQQQGAGEDPKVLKSVNDEVIKVASHAFLDFRKKLTMLFKPEVGVIDDMIVTWQNRYHPKDEAGKEGKLNIVMYVKSIPDEKTGTQSYNSFTVEAKMNFTTDPHPATEEEDRKQKAAEVAKAASDKMKAEAATPTPAAVPQAAAAQAQAAAVPASANSGAPSEAEIL